MSPDDNKVIMNRFYEQLKGRKKEKQYIKNMNYTTESLLGLVALSGGTTADLLMKGNYLWGVVFLVVTAGLVFVRGYTKIS